MSTQERVKMLREAEPNSWIALSGDESRVVGRGATYAEAVERAEEEGVTMALWAADRNESRRSASWYR